jgi:hypothetical protein
MSEKINFVKYSTERAAKLGNMMKELRVSEELFKKFQSKHNEVASKYGLQLTEEERDQISAAVSSPGSDDLSTDALEAVAGGGNFGCDTTNHCPGPVSPQSW